jgi:divalent metal cation (Fe/Co/Zn/Cd) transporter
MDQEQKYFRTAYLLSLFTIIYNIVEGFISMAIGLEDETLALFGFGADSFIEVMSGIGIAMMILRIRNNPDSSRNSFETSALRITGTGFYLLAATMLIGAILNVVYKHKPETTFWGVVISLVSIVVMIWLLQAKLRIGEKLHSEPIISDAKCTKVCIYMSLVVLASSLLYETTGFAYADSIGALGLMYFSITEGKEAFEKAKGKTCSCEH